MSVEVLKSEVKMTREEKVRTMENKDAACNERFCIAVKATGIVCISSCLAKTA